MKNEVLEELQRYSEILRIRPSTIIALLVENCLEDWVKEHSQEVFKKIWRNE
jgi:hypothetical protein